MINPIKILQEMTDNGFSMNGMTVEQFKSLIASGCTQPDCCFKKYFCYMLLNDYLKSEKKDAKKTSYYNSEETSTDYLPARRRLAPRRHTPTPRAQTPVRHTSARRRSTRSRR